MSQSFPALVRVIEQHTAGVVALAQQICEIPAPTGLEAHRAAFVRERFGAQGLDPWIDEVGNVTVRRAGTGSGSILVAAHLDTVFPVGTDVQVRREGDRLLGPGIGDNSLAVAALLMLPSILDAIGMETGPDVLLCANVGEEGLGNLRGMREAVATHGDTLVAAIALEGVGLGRITNVAVGSRRLRIAVEGPGGHSWRAFGAPSAIHEIGKIIAAIAAIDVPSQPRTTFNVGAVEGGVSINTIAPQAALTLDLRSTDPAALTLLAERVGAIVQGAEDLAQGLSIRTEILGERPAGHVAEDAPIVQMSTEILRSLGLEPDLEASSTDANVPIAAGIPSVCIGLTTGGNAHRLDEYIDVPPVGLGLRQLVLLIARLGGASS